MLIKTQLLTFTQFCILELQMYADSNSLVLSMLCLNLLSVLCPERILQPSSALKAGEVWAGQGLDMLKKVAD